MSDLAVFKKSRVEQVYDRLHAMVTGPDVGVGDRLAPLRELAGKFGTSVPTVQRAVARLDREGLVVRRRGSGVYVTSRERPLCMSDSVALCVHTRGDVWGDLTSLLLGRLHADHQFAGLIDIRHPQADQMVRRLARSDVRCLIVHGNMFCPHEVFENPDLQRKPMVGIVDWESPNFPPGLVRVLSDYEAGVRMIVSHLAELGHRRVLVLGTDIQNYFLLADRRGHVTPLQSALRDTLAAAGFEWRSMSSRTGPRKETALDEAAFCSFFSGADAPTAVIGMRDTEAALGQRVLRRHLPELAERIAIVGYYNTLWSEAADPPITAVDLDVRAIAEQTMDVVDRILAGRQPEEKLMRVAPRLIVRGTSFENHAG